MKKLNITKPITTRDGRPVTNVCTNKHGDIWGLLDGEMCSRQPDGAIYAYGEHAFDWINPPETHEITVYVYKSRHGDIWASNIDHRDQQYCQALPIAKFTKTVIEGEGL